MAGGWLIETEPKHVAIIDNILNKSCDGRQFCVLFIEIIYTQRDGKHQRTAII
jgi:hypothetical protein